MFAPEQEAAAAAVSAPDRRGDARDGAAIHDIIRTVQRRLPTPILIADAAVQGPTAPHQIVMGMAMVVRAGVDVVIIGRGGGAVTDLTAFNHERVVRTIARCPVPVISAVGHEVDLSLADLAADARASTPTAAAELCVPDGAALAEVLAQGAPPARSRDPSRRRSRAPGSRSRDDGAARARRARARARRAAAPRARASARRPASARADPRATAPHSASSSAGSPARIPAAGSSAARTRSRALDRAARRGDAARSSTTRRAELGRIGAQMAALSPLAVLDRGYAMVRRIVRSFATRRRSRPPTSCACGSRKARSR